MEKKEKVRFSKNDLYEAIGMIYKIMGPRALKCCGCDYEWNEVLRIAKNFVPIDDRYPGDNIQLYGDPNFKF